MKQSIFSCPQEKSEIQFQIIEDAQVYLRNFVSLDLNNEQSIFFLNSFIAITRGWEGYTFDTKFGQNNDIMMDPEDDITQALLILKNMVDSPPNIEMLNQEENKIIDQAIKEFRKHKFILTQICMIQITDDILDKFFTSNQVLWIKPQTSQKIAYLMECLLMMGLKLNQSMREMGERRELKKSIMNGLIQSSGYELIMNNSIKIIQINACIRDDKIIFLKLVFYINEQSFFQFSIKINQVVINLYQKSLI
ncbi:hypothetical protein pb186bvf_005217 [Paramecium bursaria]